MKNIAAGANPMVVKKGIQKAVDAAVESVKADSKKVSGSADIERVATVSAADENIGKLIAEAMEKVTHDGVITIEESKTAETYSEVVEGMQFDRGYITPYMVTDTDKMEAVIDDAHILITDKKISSIQEILPLLEEVVQTGKKLVIIAEDVDGDALSTLLVNRLRGTFTCVAVKMCIRDRCRRYVYDGHCHQLHRALCQPGIHAFICIHLVYFLPSHLYFQLCAYARRYIHSVRPVCGRTLGRLLWRYLHHYQNDTGHVLPFLCTVLYCTGAGHTRKGCCHYCSYFLCRLLFLWCRPHGKNSEPAGSCTGSGFDNLCCVWFSPC